MLVEHRHASSAVTIGGPDRLAGGEELERVASFGIPTEVVVQSAGRSDGVEGGVRHCPAHLTADDVVAAAVDLAPLDAARSERWVEVTGEGVECLVVMVVGVEWPVAELIVHRGPLMSQP